VPIQRLHQLTEWYEKHERHVSTFSLISGFVFDSLTLSSIDAPRDNLWISLNLVLVGVCIILINRKENETNDERASRRRFWLGNILQFGFGAALGSFFIFYFQSATLSTSWPFLLILLGAIVANELFLRRYARLALQLSFFYLAIFSYAIFLLPIFLHRIGVLVFLASGVVSLVIIYLFVRLLQRFVPERFNEGRTLIIRAIVGIFIGVNILYFTNLIPPIPLALKDAGIYHFLEHDSRGSFILTEEERGFLSYFHLRQRIHLVPGDPLYAYSAIFSPAELDTRIIHEWQYRDSEGKWVTATRIPLNLSGGRREGFRTYSVKSNFTPGDWRVNVETPRGAVIGRINFRIEAVSKRPTLVSGVIE
jgi:hypothetical protein